jgi:DNA-binding NtrC family response regulator
VIVVAHRDQIGLALDCLKTGAYYTLHRPLDGDVLWALINVAVQRRRQGKPPKRLAAPPPTRSRFDVLLGASAPMQTVYERIQQAAATEMTVLITGETGTGKELVATAIHKHSQRKDKPYVVVHTGAIVPDLIASELFGYEKGAFTSAVTAKPGQFEQAHRGTLFLDEIGTMDMKAQIFLLRLLETQTLRRLGDSRRFLSTCACSPPPMTILRRPWRGGRFGTISTIASTSSALSSLRCGRSPGIF